MSVYVGDRATYPCSNEMAPKSGLHWDSVTVEEYEDPTKARLLSYALARHYVMHGVRSDGVRAVLFFSISREEQWGAQRRGFNLYRIVYASARRKLDEMLEEPCPTLK